VPQPFFGYSFRLRLSPAYSKSLLGAGREIRHRGGLARILGLRLKPDGSLQGGRNFSGQVTQTDPSSASITKRAACTTALTMWRADDWIFDTGAGVGQSAPGPAPLAAKFCRVVRA